MSHDPVSGIQRWDIFYDPAYCDQIMKEDGRGRFIKVSDLPALIARVRADEREAAAQRLKVVRDAADVALLGTLQTTRDRVIAAIDALEKP